MSLATNVQILKDVRDLGPITGSMLVRQHGYKEGSIYVVLKRLAAKGLILGRVQKRKYRPGKPERFYSITYQGKKTLEAQGV